MKHTKFTKFLSVLLTAVLLLTTVSVAASAVGEFTAPDGMYLISNTQSKIAPGVTENKIITNKDDGQSQVQGYAVTVDMSEGSTASFMAGYADYNGDAWKMQTVRNQADALEKNKGVNVVAGFNADIFNMQTGEPTNILVLDGKVVKEGIGKPYFAVMKDGSVKIGSSMTKEVLKDVKEAVGGFYTLVENGQKTSYGYSTGNFAPKTAVGIKADGNVVVYVADGRNVPVSVGLHDADLADIMIGLGCVDVINLDGGGSTTYAVKYEGSDDLVIGNKPSDGVERIVSSTLFIVSSAKPTGEFDHASLTPNDVLYTPYSTVEFNAVGVDSAGGKANLPDDGKFVLADESASLGTISADGKFVSNGQTGKVTVNYVSDDKVCGSVSVEIVVPDTLYVPNSEVSLGFEDTTDFGIVAKHENRTVELKAGDIEWSIVDEKTNADLGESAGTFDGLEFTTLEGVTVNANITATLKYNKKVAVSVRAVIGAMPVVMYDFEYTTDKEEAENSNGALQYVPSYKMPRFDRSIGTSSPQQAAEFYEQGYPLYCWPNDSLTDQDSMKATIVSKADGEPVRFGDKSLRIDYNYETYNKNGNSNNYLRVTSPTYFFEGSPTAIGCWVYVPEGTSDFMLYLNCCNKNEGLAYQPVTTKEGITKDWYDRWTYVEFDLNDTVTAQGAGPANAPFGFYQGCGVFWISYQAGGPRGDKTASKVYLDNIQLVYGANTDDIDNPLIDSIGTMEDQITDNETVLTSSINTFKASYSDFDGKYATGIDYDSVKMLIDGVDVTENCYINKGDEEIYLYDKYLSNGTHSIEVSVADLFGNTTSDIRYFDVKADQTSTELSLSPLNTAILGEDYVLAVTANNTNVATADVKVKILSNFVKYWNNWEVVPGDNYELDGKATYDSNNDTISFKAVKKADFSADDNTIAKIIISIPT
ncbi:MAG: phosphodiester glycosidase family protein, partial [Faecalibacterium sp.]|nr:phosphodiester glycosidase family protein [Faecalibacterium sp.]